MTESAPVIGHPRSHRLEAMDERAVMRAHVAHVVDREAIDACGDDALV